jgi:hypothetical protein
MVQLGMCGARWSVLQRESAHMPPTGQAKCLGKTSSLARSGFFREVTGIPPVRMHRNAGTVGRPDAATLPILQSLVHEA